MLKIHHLGRSIVLKQDLKSATFWDTIFHREKRTDFSIGLAGATGCFPTYAAATQASRRPISSDYTDTYGRVGWQAKRVKAFVLLRLVAEQELKERGPPNAES